MTEESGSRWFLGLALLLAMGVMWLGLLVAAGVGVAWVVVEAPDRPAITAEP